MLLPASVPLFSGLSVGLLNLFSDGLLVFWLPPRLYSSSLLPEFLRTPIDSQSHDAAGR